MDHFANKRLELNTVMFCNNCNLFCFKSCDGNLGLQELRSQLYILAVCNKLSLCRAPGPLHAYLGPRNICVIINIYILDGNWPIYSGMDSNNYQLFFLLRKKDLILFYFQLELILWLFLLKILYSLHIFDTFIVEFVSMLFFLFI